MDGTDIDSAVQILRSKGDVLELSRTLYLLDTEAPNVEILLAFDPFRPPSINSLYVIRSEDVVWASRGIGDDDRVREFLGRHS